MTKGSTLNESGMGIIEVVMMSGIMGIMMYAMMSMAQSQLNSLKFMDAKHERLNVTRQAEILLSSPSTCMANLGALNFAADTDVSISQLVTEGNQVIYDKNKILDGGIKISHIRLDDFVSLDAAAVANIPGQANLIIEFQKASSGVPMPTLKPVKLLLKVTVDDSTNLNITDCSSDSGQGDNGPSDPTNTQNPVFTEYMEDLGLPPYPEKLGCLSKGGPTDGSGVIYEFSSYDSSSNIVVYHAVTATTGDLLKETGNLGFVSFDKTTGIIKDNTNLDYLTTGQGLACPKTLSTDGVSFQNIFPDTSSDKG